MPNRFSFLLVLFVSPNYTILTMDYFRNVLENNQCLKNVVNGSSIEKSKTVLEGMIEQDYILYDIYLCMIKSNEELFRSLLFHPEQWTVI